MSDDHTCYGKNSKETRKEVESAEQGFVIFKQGGKEDVSAKATFELKPEDTWEPALCFPGVRACWRIVGTARRPM